MYGYSGVASLEAVQFRMQFLELECGGKDEFSVGVIEIVDPCIC